MTSTVHHKARRTEQQRRAIETRDVSVSLSAGAGCGKTFVLTNRYLDYFRPEVAGALAPEELHRLVAITFTERAAREMRDRIREACYQQLLVADSQTAGHWAAIVRWLDNVRVTTIHSYCATVLRTHAVEAGIDPQFVVLEQAQSETLLTEVLDDELRRLVAQREGATIGLATRFDLHGLRDVVRTMAVEARPDALEDWLASTPAGQVAAWESYFRERVLPAAARRVAESPEALQILSVLREHAADHPTMRMRRDELLERLPSLAEAASDPARLASELHAIREYARVQGGGTAKHWDDAQAYQAFKDAAKKLRGTIDDVEAIVAFDPATAVVHAEIGGRLLAIAAAVRGRYERRKEELAALDFDDLLTRVRGLLLDPANESLRRRLSAQIDLLLVDEFQDTDRVQLELVEALCGEATAGGKLFFVGDPKQSIYRFRGADPDVFRRLREATPDAGRLVLSENFRSQPAILEFVNALFWQQLGGDFEPLRAHRPQHTATPSVEFLWAAAPAGTGKEDVRSLRRREADWIARRIRAMLDDKELLVAADGGDASGGPSTRAAAPGDVAILFRALSDVQLYEDALRRHGIDYSLVGGHAFYAQQEIFDLLNLLRAVVSPSDEISLAGALRSGLFALADETLFWLAQHPDGLAAGLAAGEIHTEIADDQQQRVAYAAAVLGELRDNKNRLRISELVERAMSLTGYDATLLAEFLGERKLANLRKVIEQARSFERGGAFGLTDFIAELSEYVARQPKEPLAATLAEDTNVVRLMTIHQAKGLEFPIVFVVDVDRSVRPGQQRAHFDPELGPLVAAPENDSGSAPAGGYDLWRFVERDEELAELHRLLYVATTRAADYLVLSSGVTRLGGANGPWTHLLEQRFDLLSGGLRGPLPDDEPHPRIKVTTAEPVVKPTSAARQSMQALDKVLGKLHKRHKAKRATIPGVDPLPVDLRARREYSFSRLTGHLHRRNEGGDEDGAEPSGGDPLGLGTLVHSVLAAIDVARPGAWEPLVRLHAERQRIDPEGPLVEDAERLIARFLASPRADHLAAARQSYAEAEFLLAWPVDAQHDPSTLLTGYIDRLYQDADGRWHVLDFKTNRVTSASVERVAAGYEMQMLLYGLASEGILGEAPESLVLHFLRTGAEHRFAWNDAARRRAVELVDAGIASAIAAPPRRA